MAGALSTAVPEIRIDKTIDDGRWTIDSGSSPFDVLRVHKRITSHD
jgi:hypothetical protein